MFDGNGDDNNGEVMMRMGMPLMGCMMMRRRCMLIGIRAKVTHGLLAPCWTRNDAAGDDDAGDDDDIYIMMMMMLVVIMLLYHIKGRGQKKYFL